MTSIYKNEEFELFDDTFYSNGLLRCLTPSYTLYICDNSGKQLAHIYRENGKTLYKLLTKEEALKNNPHFKDALSFAASYISKKEEEIEDWCWRN